MKKNYIKLISMACALLLAVSVMVMSTYAWLVLSESPVASGIQVAIGGSNTILLAADIQTTGEDGTVYHYPGVFSSKLNFSQLSAYSYLQELAGLSPVSTSNGIQWILPTYYSGSDEQVQEGLAMAGKVKDVSEFTWENTLAHANLKTGDDTAEGSYVYLDFWVVSTGGDYYLRVSNTAEDSSGSGSFVIDLLTPTEVGGSYTLEETENTVSNAIRVGFLANVNDVLDEEAWNAYAQSLYYDSRFTSLRGMYIEAGQQDWESESNRFTIYEPNGYSDTTEYKATSPLGLVNGQITAVSVADITTVQATSSWDSKINEIFQAAITGKSISSASDAATEFYVNYLQGQVGAYVNKGAFWNGDEEAGATDDVFIVHLEKNVPQRIRMFIWIEGQDSDCPDSTVFTNVAVNIQLAGGNH